MGVVFDIVIVAIIVLSTYLAYRKGLAVLAIKLCAVIISLVVTLILYKPIANFVINTTGIDETIQNTIYEKSFELMKSEQSNDTAVDILEQTQTATIGQTARNLSIQIVEIGVIIVLYFGIKFALKFVTAIANKVANLPIINKFNKAGGIVYGILRGLVVVYVCLLLIGFAGKVNPKNYLFETVGQSSLGKMMYENNVFNILL